MSLIRLLLSAKKHFQPDEEKNYQQTLDLRQQTIYNLAMFNERR